MKRLIGERSSRSLGWGADCPGGNCEVAHNQLRRCLAVGALLWCLVGRSFGQGPTLAPETPLHPGGERSLLGPSPGALPRRADGVAGGQQETLGGRPGPSVPRVPSAITERGQRPIGVPEQEAITAPPSLPLAEIPLFGPLAFPGGKED